MPDESYLDKATRLAVAHENNRVKHDADGELTVEDVEVVWFCKTLHNWSAFLRPTGSNKKRWEVNYDDEHQTTYVTSYQKWENSTYPDEETFAEPGPLSVVRFPGVE